MSDPGCPHLDEVSSAADSALPTELERHAAGCPVCADARLVESFLLDSATRMVPVALPDARSVYWRARRRAQVERAERATRPIAVFNKVAYAVGAAVLSSLALGQGRTALGWLHRLGEHASGAAHAAASAPTPIGSVSPVGPAVAAIVLVAPLLLWGLYLTWAEE